MVSNFYPLHWMFMQRLNVIIIKRRRQVPVLFHLKMVSDLIIKKHQPVLKWLFNLGTTVKYYFTVFIILHQLHFVIVQEVEKKLKIVGF